MKNWYPLFALLSALGLSACGPTVESEPASADTLGSATAELNTCTNDCAAYGGQAISCSGNTCTAAKNYVVCDGRYTYCQPPVVTCTNDCAGYGGQAISCTGSTCSTGADYVVCDGAYTYCQSCTSPTVGCPDGTLLRCTGTSSCGLGTSNGCSVQCDGQEYSCAGAQPGRFCPNDA